MAPPQALVVGAGIGGLAAAIALRRAGVRVAVYEQARLLDAVGAGLSVLVVLALITVSTTQQAWPVFTKYGASYFFSTHVSPPIFTSRPELMPGSLRRVLDLDPRWLVPNHYDVLDGDLHKRRFRELCRRVLGQVG